MGLNREQWDFHASMTGKLGNNKREFHVCVDGSIV